MVAGIGKLSVSSTLPIFVQILFHKKKPLFEGLVKMVAGIGFEPMTFGL